MTEPIIPLGILTGEGIKLYDFMVDSGADLTLLPRHLANDLGIDLKKCPMATTLGVEGRGIKIFYSTIQICIGNRQDRIRCAIAKHDRIPPLLGRLDVFSRYDITFNAKRRSIVFRHV